MYDSELQGINSKPQKLQATSEHFWYQKFSASIVLCNTKHRLWNITLAFKCPKKMSSIGRKIALILQDEYTNWGIVYDIYYRSWIVITNHKKDNQFVQKRVMPKVTKNGWHLVPEVVSKTTWLKNIAQYKIMTAQYRAFVTHSHY